jgi:hypothetical protein
MMMDAARQRDQQGGQGGEAKDGADWGMAHGGGPDEWAGEMRRSSLQTRRLRDYSPRRRIQKTKIQASQIRMDERKTMNF